MNIRSLFDIPGRIVRLAQKGDAQSMQKIGQLARKHSEYLSQSIEAMREHKSPTAVTELGYIGAGNKNVRTEVIEALKTIGTLHAANTIGWIARRGSDEIECLSAILDIRQELGSSSEMDKEAIDVVKILIGPEFLLSHLQNMGNGKKEDLRNILTRAVNEIPSLQGRDIETIPDQMLVHMEETKRLAVMSLV